VWLSMNPNPNAIKLLEQNADKIAWRCLSTNPAGIDILSRNPDKIDWWMLSKNSSAIHMLEQTPDMIDWECLSENPNAISILSQNQDKIDWRGLSENPSIFEFEYDYKAMKDHMHDSGICEALMANRFHPSNVDKFGYWGFEEMVPAELHEGTEIFSI